MPPPRIRDPTTPPTFVQQLNYSREMDRIGVTLKPGMRGELRVGIAGLPCGRGEAADLRDI